MARARKRDKGRGLEGATTFSRNSTCSDRTRALSCSSSSSAVASVSDLRPRVGDVSDPPPRVGDHVARPPASEAVRLALSAGASVVRRRMVASSLSRSERTYNTAVRGRQGGSEGDPHGQVGKMR
eukprot:1330835-Rhodomonas_salina.2